jgi:type VI secretion system secreted protein VgrG
MIKGVGPVTLSGDVTTDLAFRSMTLSEGVSSPFHYVLDLLSDSQDLKADDFLGEPMSVHLEIDSQEARHFNGFITEFCLLGSVGENTLYRVTLRPWLWFLQRATNCRIFQDKTVVDIVLEVFRAHHFDNVELRLTGEYSLRQYVVQYRESDYAFVSRLLEDEGIYFFFTHTLDLHMLVLCDSRSSHDPAPDCKTLEYHPRDANRQAIMAYVDEWQVTHRVESGAYVMRDFDFRGPAQDLQSLVKDPAAHEHASYEVFDYPGGYDDLGAGDVRVRRRLAELQSTRSVAQGQSNARGLRTGALFTLEKHPILGQNREYLVLSVEGVIRTHALESAYGEDAGGEVFRCQFTCIDKALPYRPPRKTPRPVVQGTQTAIVVGPEHEEIWTDEHGRVKLKFHWDRKLPVNENASCWVRVAQVWAGTNFGAMFIPRKGQEVLVEFLEGDPDRPIVTGRVYNFDNMPPYELGKYKTQSGIKSRSTLKGNPDNFNEIRFEDQKGAEDLFIHAEKTQTTKVKQSQSVSVGGSRSVTVGDTQTTTVTKKETQKYLDAREMTVDKTNEETVTLAHTGTYKQGRTFKVSAKDDALTVTGANKTTTVSGNYHIQADTEYQVTQKANVISLNASKASVTNGKCTLTLIDGKITMEAPEGITITCGGTSITLTPKDCTVKADTLNLDGGTGGGRLALDAAGASLSGKTKTSLASKATLEITGSIVKIN